MTSTPQSPPDSAKTAYVGGASARATDRCFGARLHALLAAGLATLLVSLAVAVRPERTYTTQVAIGLPLAQTDWGKTDADDDGLALDSAALSTQLAAALQDDAALARAAESAHLQMPPTGATALLKALRAVTLVAPNADAAGPGAQITVESKNAAEAQALALALADGFADDYRRRALARGQQAVTEARQAVKDSAAAAQASQQAFDEFLASHFAQAAAPAAPSPATSSPVAPAPKPAVESPAPLAVESSEPTTEPAAPAALPEERELQRLKQERRQLLVRYTKYHYKVQVVDMHIARLEKELAILAPQRAGALPAPKPAEAAPPPEPSPDAAALSLEAAAQEAAAAASAEAEAQRQQLTSEFETLRAQVEASRAAAGQAVVQERAALEHQATLANQAELRVAAPTLTYRTAEGLDRRGLAWSLLLAATVGGLAFCMAGPQRHVYRTPAEVEDDLELPLVAALASRSAALPRRPKVLPAIAARLTACGELVLVAIVCGLAVLAYLEPDFRTQLIESPLAAYTDAASRLLGR